MAGRKNGLNPLVVVKRAPALVTTPSLAAGSVGGVRPHVSPHLLPASS